MNRIVREHYPVSNLPEDLREVFEGQADVRVTIDTAASRDASAAHAPFSRFRHVHRSNDAGIDDIVPHIRSLRDEWNDRER